MKKFLINLMVLVLIFFILANYIPYEKGVSIPYVYFSKRNKHRDMKIITFADGEKFIKGNHIPKKQDISGKYHPINEFLKGFRPFEIKNPFLGWKWVLENIKYKNDFKRFGREDVWQFAKTTYLIRTGDCEDSSILLCDWLRSYDYDANVAVGLFKNYGWHSWVILNTEQKTYLLECTGKKKSLKRGPLLLGIKKHPAQSEYKTYCIFNERGFWISLEYLKRRNGNGA